MLYLPDRDETETETFDFSKLSRPKRDETFQKTSRDRLETETFKTETTSLVIRVDDGTVTADCTL